EGDYEDEREEVEAADHEGGPAEGPADSSAKAEFRGDDEPEVAEEDQEDDENEREAADFGDAGVMVAGLHLVGLEGGTAGDDGLFEVREIGRDFGDGAAHAVERCGDFGERRVVARRVDVDDE